MARLTHLALESNTQRILRGGIKAATIGPELAGVYAMPLLPSFFVSHQWLRELRRRQPGALVAIDFVIPDATAVLVGHYHQPHHEMLASEAAGLILHAEDARGYELILPRAVGPKEIRRVRHVDQVVGWRYWPDAHGTRPCPCPACLARGEYGAARLRTRYD